MRLPLQWVPRGGVRLQRGTPIRVAILLHNKLRDLPSSVDLALELEARGHDAVVLPLGFYVPLRRFRPDAVVLPDAVNGSSRGAAEWARAQGLRVVTLNQEGAINRAFEDLWAGAGLDPSLEDAIIVCGEHSRQLLVRNGRDPSRIFVCGHPRMDKYFRALPSKEDFCRSVGWDPARPLVFYPGSLQWARGVNYTERDYTFLERPEETLERLIALRYETNDAFFRLIRRHPEINFVFKIHPYDGQPSEYFDAERWLAAPNFKVVFREGDIADYLPVANLMLCWGGTSTTEGWVFGLPTISLQFDSRLDFFLPPSAAGTDIVRNETELEDRLRHYLAGGRIPPQILEAREAFVREWYGPVDGGAVRRCADVIEQTLRNNPPAFRKRRTWAELRSYLLHAAKAATGRGPHERLVPGMRPYPDVATPEDVRYWMDRLRPLRDGRPPAASARPAGP